MSKEKARLPRTAGAILAVGLIIGASAIGFLLVTPYVTDSGKMQVVTSFYPLYYLSSEIGGERAEVHMLIPDNAEPHSWEPSPSDLIRVSEAQVLVYNGAGFEPWVGDLLSSVGNPGLVVVDTSANMPLMPPDGVRESYEEAALLRQEGEALPFWAAEEPDQAPFLPGLAGSYRLLLVEGQGGLGGFVRLIVSTSGEYGIFLEDGAHLTVLEQQGSELEAELSYGPMTWYPQFSSASFYDLESGTYVLQLSASSNSSLQLVLSPQGGHEEGHEHEEEGHDHGQSDPHFWLDPLSAKVQVSEILSAFQAADPGNSSYYQANAEVLEQRLDVLHRAFLEGLADRTKNDIVTTHEGFNYLAYRYGFRAHAAMGISADQQPSPRDLVQLSDLVRELGLAHVFSEPVYNDAVMETIASETGAQLLVLDGLHGRTGIHSRLDYFGIMYANLENLRVGLGAGG